LVLRIKDIPRIKNRKVNPRLHLLFVVPTTVTNLPILDPSDHKYYLVPINLELPAYIPLEVMGPLSVYTRDSSSETLRFPKLE